MSDELITARTYPLTARTRSVMDTAAIMLPGYSKSDVINTAILWLGLEISRRRENGDTVKAAFESIRSELTRKGYGSIIASLIPDQRSQTKLDRFLDGVDDDADASEIIIGMMGFSERKGSESKGDGQ